nr:unnamed protein product [Callosobruchus analis]
MSSILRLTVSFERKINLLYIYA